MSHFTRVETEFRDRDLLIAAIQATEGDDRTLEMGGEVDGRPVDLAVRQHRGDDVGFARTGDGRFELVGEYSTVERYRRTVRPEYAAQVALQAAIEAGWRNVERRSTGEGGYEVVGDPPEGGEASVAVGADGDVELEVDGLMGRSCVRASRPIEEALGTVEERERKPAFYRRPEADRARERNGRERDP